MTDNNSQPAAAAMTIGQICQELSLNPNTPRMQWRRAGFSDWSINRQATTAEAEWLRTTYANGPRGARRTQTPAPAKPVATPAAVLVRKPAATPARKTTVTIAAVLATLALPNLIIWAEIGLGLIGLTRLFSIAGLIGSVIMAAFFENARRTMTLPLRTVLRSDFDTDQSYNEAYNLATEYNDATRRRKYFAFVWCSVITLTFCWGNGQTMYAAISATHPELVHATAFTIEGATYTIADVAARWFAVLLSGLAFLSLRSIALKHN